MSKTLMRGLALLEAIDLYGPITIMELARQVKLDKSITSRTVSALEEDGWVIRAEGKVELGPRAALLGHSSLSAEAVRIAEPLVHAIAGVTGLLTQVYGLVGTRAVVLAAAGGRGPSTPVGLGTDVPLFATAAGKVVAAQLSPQDLDRRLPPEPYPDPVAELIGLAGFPPIATALNATEDDVLSSSTVAHDRQELERQLAAVRDAGLAIDDGEFHPAMGCIAIPWPRAGLPAAFACMGSPADIATAETFVQTVLRTATEPGARPEDIVAGAAEIVRPRPGKRTHKRG